MTIDQYRKRWVRLHKKYEKRSYKLLMQMFKQEANKIPYESLTQDTYEATIDAYITNEDIFKAYFEIYKFTGLAQGKLVGKQINKEIKNFIAEVFESDFNRALLEWIGKNTAYRIISVRDEFSLFIKQIIAKGFEEGKTVSQLAEDIRKLIGKRNFYRWQALRIARTETSAAANYGATVAANNSGVLLEKIWISAEDERVRRRPKSKFDHAIMNGVKVDKDDSFNVQGELLPFPASPTTESGANSSASNTINCRCTLTYVPKRDSNGRIIRI